MHAKTCYLLFLTQRANEQMLFLKFDDLGRSGRKRRAGKVSIFYKQVEGSRVIFY